MVHPTRAADRLQCILVVLLTVGVLGGCASLMTQRASLDLVHRELIEKDSLEHLYSLRLVDPGGDSVVAFLRRPAAIASGEQLPGIVLVAGRATGRRAAQVIPGPLEGVVLAVEYPRALAEDLSAWTLLRRLSSIGQSAYQMPRILTGAAAFLADQPAIDANRLALVGVSFGVPFAAVAGKDPIFRGVALHHGGANLDLLLRTNLPIENAALRAAVAGFTAWYLRPLDPEQHVGAIAPTPLLLVNGLHDELVPIRSARELREAARPPVRQIWLPHNHLMPGDRDVMRELADSTLSHFEFLQDRRTRERLQNAPNW